MARRSPVLAPRIPVQLTQVTTADGVVLAGIMVEPKGRKKTAIIYVHGLGSSFSSGIPRTDAIVAMAKKDGFGYFAFNTRGHDLVSRAGKKIAGAGFEVFTECLRDIDAMIHLVRRCGYKRIILMGHSTGANKALYYTYRRPKKIHGLILSGPLSDVAGSYATEGMAVIQRNVRKAKLLMKKNPHAVMTTLGGAMSAQRYLSLYEPGHSEDVFPYYRKASWKELRSVRAPLLVVVGQHDQYLDRSASQLLSAFEERAVQAPAVTTVAIPKADHGFHGQEKQLVTVIREWLTTVV